MASGKRLHLREHARVWQVLALTYMLEKEVHGSAHIRVEPVEVLGCVWIGSFTVRGCAQQPATMSSTSAAAALAPVRPFAEDQVVKPFDVDSLLFSHETKADAVDAVASGAAAAPSGARCIPLPTRLTACLQVPILRVPTDPQWSPLRLTQCLCPPPLPLPTARRLSPPPPPPLVLPRARGPRSPRRLRQLRQRPLR